MLTKLLKHIIDCLRNGVGVFRRSLHGSYEMSPLVKSYIEELSNPNDGALIDKANLMADRKAVARDVNAAFRKIKSNG